MGLFSPEQFMDVQVEGASSTEFVPVPVGEYTAVSSDPEIVAWSSKDGSKNGLKLSLKWDIDDPAVKQLLERDKVTVKQDIMLDLTETGGLDMGKGKNVNLGRLREACGLNVPGQPFSFRMLGGQIAKVRVEHRIVDGAPFAEIKAVSKMA